MVSGVRLSDGAPGTPNAVYGIRSFLFNILAMSHYLTDFLQDSKRDKSRLILPAVGFRLRPPRVILSEVEL